MRAVVNGLSLMYLIFFKINWIRFFRLKNKSSENIIWLYQDCPKEWYKYIFGGYLVLDFSLVWACIEKNKDFYLVFGSDLKTITGKNILYTVSQRFNRDHEADYTRPLISTISQLEMQGNILYPSSAEAMYWENKIYMHQQFKALEIPQPDTGFIGSNFNLDEAFRNHNFPLLIKEAHSRHSQGIYKVNNKAEAIEIIAERRKVQVTDFLVQELVEMRRDLRVILIGDEIVLHYWRINLADKWKPTSTSHGSMVDFGSFPDQWSELIIDVFKRLKLTTGAFDICFRNDDTAGIPVFLEVSSVYQPNPKPTGKNANIPYYAYKKRIFTSNPYFKASIDVVYDLRQKEIDCFFKKLKSVST